MPRDPWPVLRVGRGSGLRLAREERGNASGHPPEAKRRELRNKEPLSLLKLRFLTFTQAVREERPPKRKAARPVHLSQTGSRPQKDRCPSTVKHTHPTTPRRQASSTPRSKQSRASLSRYVVTLVHCSFIVHNPPNKWLLLCCTQNAHARGVDISTLLIHARWRTRSIASVCFYLCVDGALLVKYNCLRDNVSSSLLVAPLRCVD